VGGFGRRWLDRLGCPLGRTPGFAAGPSARSQPRAKPTLLNIGYKAKEWNFPLDLMTILLFVMLGVFVFMMFRRNKKTQQQQAELQSKFGTGVDVMTSFGLYGRIISIDEDENKVVLELSPGNLATVHRQAVTKIIEPAAAAAAEPTVVPDDASSLTGHDADRADAVNRADTVNETPEESLNRLNDEGKKDS
jgi:preprotein translocase subunit YajC